jgi:hypothetical protein
MRNPIVDCSSILVARLPRMGLAKALYSSTYSTGVEWSPMASVESRRDCNCEEGPTREPLTTWTAHIARFYTLEVSQTNRF